MANELIALDVRGVEEFERLVNRVPNAIYSQFKTELQKTVLNTHGKITARINNGNPLHNRTGALRRSFGFDVSGTTLATLRGSIFTKSSYAPIHETGGTVRAKSAYRNVPGGPYLNIPLSANKTPAGVTRMQAREVFSSGGYIVKSRAGKWFVILNGQPMFVLKKQVTIPARLGMRKVGDEEAALLLSRLRQLPPGLK